MVLPAIAVCWQGDVCVVGLVWAIARGSANMGTNPCTIYTPITCNCFPRREFLRASSFVSAMLPRVAYNSVLSVSLLYISVTKTSQLMLYREIMAVCS